MNRNTLIKKLKQYPDNVQKCEEKKRDIELLKNDKERILAGERLLANDDIKVQSGLSKQVQTVVEQAESIDIKIKIAKAELKEIKREIREVDKRMKVLRSEEQEIIKARYLCKGKPEEFWRIAKRLSYSPDWVRHACMKALAKMCFEKKTQNNTK